MRLYKILSFYRVIRRLPVDVSNVGSSFFVSKGKRNEIIGMGDEKILVKKLNFRVIRKQRKAGTGGSMY